MIQVQEQVQNVQSNDTVQSAQVNSKNTVFETRNFDLWYGQHHALKNINLEIKENEVTAIIGPSGCGKSTYVKTLNRMIELVPIVRTSKLITVGAIFWWRLRG